MWSPQHYLSEGRARGIPAGILANAVDQIERVILRHPNLPPILSLKDLARRTSLEYATLRELVERDHDPYRRFPIKKRSGGARWINVPEPSLMLVQRWIAKYILSPIPVHHCSFAFSPGSSIVKCAARHSGARWLIKMDITGFFTSISEIQVYRTFLKLGYQPLVAFELARLTTHAPKDSPRYNMPQWRAFPKDRTIKSYNFKGIGYLPQGAPTSPMLSNLAMDGIDRHLESLARRHQVTYTRYCDDLIFSTRSLNFDRSVAANLIGDVTKILLQVGLFPQHRKTIVVPPGSRKMVLGLLVDGTIPRLPIEFRSKIRQHIYYLEKVGPIEHAKNRQFDTVFGLYNHIKGLVDFAKMVDADYSESILKRLKMIDWPF